MFIWEFYGFRSPCRSQAIIPDSLARLGPQPRSARLLVQVPFSVPGLRLLECSGDWSLLPRDSFLSHPLPQCGCWAWGALSGRLPVPFDMPSVLLFPALPCFLVLRLKHGRLGAFLPQP